MNDQLQTRVRRGRHALPESDRMSASIEIRMTTADKERFESAARRDLCLHADNSAHLSLWIRGLMDERDAHTL